MIKPAASLLCFMLCLLIPPASAHAEGSESENTSILDRFTNSVHQTWKSSVYEAYLPFWTWHNRLAYEKSKAQEYNEFPQPGFGLGKAFTDDDGDWHALYAIGFKDSNNQFQPMAGYAFQKNWKLDADGDWRTGLGFTLGLTGRHEYDYIPLPLPLPLAGIQYKNISLQAVYVPGLRNEGNVLFCWLRFRLN